MKKSKKDKTKKMRQKNMRTKKQNRKALGNMQACQNIPNFCFEDINKLRLIEMENIRNIQRNDPLKQILLREPSGKLTALSILHNKNNISPRDLLFRNRLSAVKASRPCLEPAFEDHLSSSAPILILIADKQQFHTGKINPEQDLNLFITQSFMQQFTQQAEDDNAGLFLTTKINAMAKKAKTVSK